MVGYLCGEVDVMSVTGATVYVDEVPEFEPAPLSTKKIRNFQNLKRQSAADAAKERAAEEAALLLLQEEKRIAEEAAKRPKAKDPDGEVSLFSSVGDAFAASVEIEKQLAEGEQASGESRGAPWRAGSKPRARTSRTGSTRSSLCSSA